MSQSIDPTQLVTGPELVLKNLPISDVTVQRDGIDYLNETIVS